MLEAINGIVKAVTDEVSAAQSLAELEAVRVKFLGKKGALTAILKGMGTLTPEERKITGQAANEAREEIEAILAQKLTQLETADLEQRLASEAIDVTMPAKASPIGKRHPLNLVLD